MADAAAASASDAEMPDAPKHEELEDEEELRALEELDDGGEDGASEGKQTPATDAPQMSAAARKRLEAKKKKEAKKAEEDAQQAAVAKEVDADKASTARNRLKYLLDQTELYGHFMKKKHNEQPAKGEKRKRGRIAEEEEDEELVKEVLEEEEPATQHHTRLTAQPPSITGQMRAYQLEGLNWLIRLYENGINGILADEMGLGKTLQTISLLAFLKDYKNVRGPHLVITPKSTLFNWCNELKRWCPSLNVIKFHGTQEEREGIREEINAGKFDVVCTTYEVAIKEKGALKRWTWRYIIIDEAHRIKNEKSVLSRVVRTFNTQCRLLLTGTPLQNNLRELWALLNFLLPEIFGSAEDFDEWFNIGTGFETEAVAQLHKVLRPFLLRRLKVEVEKSLPPKKVMQLYVGYTAAQRDLYMKILQRDLEAVNGVGSDRVRLLNILMQLRKVCNHPYLFDGVEPKFNGVYVTAEHIVENCGKMVLLDKLLKRLRETGDRVLIFSQMTRMLDILQDYCEFRGYEYCRIDGDTDGDVRERSVAEFNAPDSSKFLFLLSTRAGGLGINLATANIVVLYDSDWNPQVDLQAQDRAHRIGQTKPVTVYRLVTEGTIEEKIIERAEMKLRLDQVVIQQGRLPDQAKTLTKGALLDMVRHGAEAIFRAGDASISEEGIDEILNKGTTKSAELESKFANMGESSLLTFSTDGGTGFQTFEGVDYTRPGRGRWGSGNLWIEPPKRERKVGTYSENRQRSAEGPSKPKGGPKQPREPPVYDFQFFNKARLDELYRKELAVYQYELEQWNKRLAQSTPAGDGEGADGRASNSTPAPEGEGAPKKEDGPDVKREEGAPEVKKEAEEAADGPRPSPSPTPSTSSAAPAGGKKGAAGGRKGGRASKEEEKGAGAARASPTPSEGAERAPPPPFTEEDRAEREALMQDGFRDWSKRDFQAYIRACEKYGRKDIEDVSKEVEGKTPEEVREYHKVFWKRYQEIADYEKIIKQIEKGEQKLRRRDEMMEIVRAKVARYRNPLHELKIAYGSSRGKTFTEDEDRFLLTAVAQHGFGEWELIKNEVRKAPQFRFDYYMKSRTPLELCRRFEQLVKLIEKEAEDDEEEGKGKRASARDSSADARKSGGSATGAKRKESDGAAAAGAGGKRAKK
eukprot:tig00000128_g7211.t1